MEREFKVTVEIPKGVTVREMTDYIQTAVKSMCGCYERTDPIFELDRESVKVNQQYKRKG